MSVAYRRDVDGLRAVAIIPVILFHFAVPGFSGGYVGVDVFFVISGFLITSLIYNEIKNREFSFVHFYERRIRRIFPALFFVLFVCGVLAYIELFPAEFDEYARSVAATGLFLSNVEFWNQAGYFAQAADQKPLLHTWSLAVEEQFYLIFPPLMLLTARYLKGRYVTVLLLIFVVSLAVSIRATSSAPLIAFYMLPSRMWELLMGSLIAVGAVPLVTNAKTRGALSALGLAMIAYACVTYSSDTRFPGLAAIAPCLGAALIIVAGRAGAPAVNRMLSTGPMVFIGKISYSLYLWHWPLYVFAKYELGRDLSALETVGLIALSIALAAFSWRYVEQPFRGQRPILTRPTLFTGAGAAIAMATIFGAVVVQSNGLPQRFSPYVQTLLAPTLEIDEGRCPELVQRLPSGEICSIGSRSDAAPSFFLWGDSHAGAMIPAIAAATVRHGSWGLSAMKDGCPPLLGVDRSDFPNHFCQRYNDEVLAFLRSSGVETVILVGRWTLNVESKRYGTEAGSDIFLEDANSNGRSPEQSRRVFDRGFRQTVETLGMAGYRVLVVGPIPEIGQVVPQTLARRHMRGQSEDIGPTAAAFEQRNQFVLTYFREYTGGAEFVYPHRLLCSESRCAVTREGKPLYADDDHLSRFGAESISSLFEPLFATLSDSARRAAFSGP